MVVVHKGGDDDEIPDIVDVPKVYDVAELQNMDVIFTEVERIFNVKCFRGSTWNNPVF